MPCKCDPKTPVLGRLPDGRMRCVRCRKGRRLRQQRSEVGFVVTPGEIWDRVESLDNAVTKLDADVKASTEPKLNAAWRTEWDAFVRRWALERDSYKSWSSRLFATRAMPRIDSFVDSYKLWARQFEQRTGSPPRVAVIPKPEGIADSLIPNEVWYLAAAAVVLLVLTRK